MFWKLLALVLPLGLDTFAVAAALAIAGLPKGERLRVSALFTAFEAGMPIVGLLIGAAVGQAVGGIADYVAIAALLLLGGYMLWPREEDEEEERLELLGLLRLPVVLVLVWIGVQGFVVAQAGLRLGARVGESMREGAERLAGLVLAALGLLLLGLRLAGRG